MVEESSVSQAVIACATWLPRAAGAMFEWGGSSGVCRDAGLHTVSEDRQQPAFQVKGQPTTARRAYPYWTTGEICLVSTVSRRAIVWEKEAAGMIFALDPVLLADIALWGISRATGELVWVPCQEPPVSPSPAVHPALLVPTLSASLLGAPVIIVPALHAHDPLLHHVALLLQAAVDAESTAGQLYAEVLAEALVNHFLRRYAAAQPTPRGERRARPGQAAAYARLYPRPSRSGVVPAHARRRGADEPDPFCAPVQARHRAGAPPVRKPMPDRAGQAVAGRH
jgi:hypothetical protein